MGRDMFLQDVDRTATSLLEMLLNYEASQHIHVVSHRADADGLAAEVVLGLGLRTIADALGSPCVVTSERAMEYGDVVHVPGRHYVYADLPTTPADCGGSIIDHHPSTAFPGALNPWNHGIDGESECSGGVSAAFVLRSIGKQLEIEGLQRSIDYLTIIGLAGGQADQQGPHGMNAALYKDLEIRRALQRIDFPLYGYHLNSAAHVLAESSIPLNCRFDVASRSQGLRFLNSLGPIRDHNAAERFLHRFGLLFCADGKGNVGLNRQYWETLSESERTAAADAVHTTTGSSWPPEDAMFADYWDDESFHDARVTACAQRLRGWDVDPEAYMYSLKPKVRSGIIEEYRRNVQAFADPRVRDGALAELAEEQYCIMHPNHQVVGHWSVAELANLMTALSKRGKGELFLDACAYELADRGRRDDILYEQTKTRIRDEHRNHRTAVYEGMRHVESMVAGERFHRINDDAIYIDLDNLQDCCPDLSVMTGIYAQLSFPHMPRRYGIISTGCRIGDGRRKVSLRSRFPDDRPVDLGAFCQDLVASGVAYSGGGHKEAASCRLPTAALPKFLEALESYAGGLHGC